MCATCAHTLPSAPRPRPPATSLLRVGYVSLTLGPAVSQGLGKKLRGGGTEGGVLSGSHGGLLGSLAQAVSALWRDRAAVKAEERADLQQADGDSGTVAQRGVGMIERGAEVFFGGSPSNGRLR